MRRALVAELQRLVRRARARWPLIVGLAAVLTAAVLYKLSKKVDLHRGVVVLAVQEGNLTDGHHPMPVHELENYIGSVLLSKQVLEGVIEEYDLFPLRHRQGMEYALAELWDMLAIHVRRNYFLYSYDVDAPRSARIAIVVTSPDPDLAWRLARRIADLVIEGEQRRRLSVAEQLAREADLALAQVRARVDGLEQRVIAQSIELGRAERAGEEGRASALRLELAELDTELRQQTEVILNLTQQANADEQAAAIDRAGLGMSFQVAEERRPWEPPGAALYVRIILGGVVFFVLLPVVALFIGAFDTRIHDREDAERIGLTVLGHVPGFPGDGVGSLRDRGVRGRRVPS